MKPVILPACNRCQFISETPDAPNCPYCGNGWTHDVEYPEPQQHGPWMKTNIPTAADWKRAGITA